MTALFPYEDPLRRCLKAAEWPEKDQQLWHSLFTPGDILDGTVGRGFHWSTETREKYRKGYGRWLTFLITTGQFDPEADPTSRVTQERVSDYLIELTSQVSSWTAWGRMAELLAVIKAFTPDQDWGWLRRMVRFLETNGRDSRNKHPRLRPAPEIAAWGYNRMDDIIAVPPQRDPASHFRDDLMIALLITCPAMRRGNLAMIEIGKHLRVLKEGYQLFFSPDETKTDKPLSIPVVDSLSPYISHYIEKVRPQILQGSGSPQLWFTKYGKPMKDKMIGQRITTVTKQAFGKPINPHLFRDCAVTTVAIDDPEHICIAAPILGHTDPRTTEKHYIQANAIVAGRRLRCSVDRLRKEHMPPARHKKKEDGDNHEH